MRAEHPRVHQSAIDRLHWMITFDDADGIDLALRLGDLYLQ